MAQLSLVQRRWAAARKEQWSHAAATAGSGVARTTGSAKHLPGSWYCQHQCPQCSEQWSLMAEHAMATGDGSPSQLCPLLLDAAPWEGPGSTSPPPLTLTHSPAPAPRPQPGPGFGRPLPH